MRCLRGQTQSLQESLVGAPTAVARFEGERLRGVPVTVVLHPGRCAASREPLLVIGARFQFVHANV